MATIAEIVDDVLDELRVMSGTNAQIHLQNSIVKNVSRIYRTLNKRYVFKDYLQYNTVAIDGTTGLPTTAVTAFLAKYTNIVAIFREFDTTPLPFVAGVTNIARLRRPTIVPSGESHIFKIAPASAINVTVVSKFFTEADFDYTSTADIPFDRDALAIGAAYMLAIKTGVNDQLTKSLGEQFDQIITTLKLQQLEDIYPTNLIRGSYPTEWYVDE